MFLPSITAAMTRPTDWHLFSRIWNCPCYGKYRYPLPWTDHHLPQGQKEQKGTMNTRNHITPLGLQTDLVAWRIFSTSGMIIRCFVRLWVYWLSFLQIVRLRRKASNVRKTFIHSRSHISRRRPGFNGSRSFRKSRLLPMGEGRYIVFCTMDLQRFQ